MTKKTINTELLQAIDAIERRGSFARGALELGKTSSTLSYTIQKFEEQLGLAIYRRQGRRSVLTPAGQLLLAEGREILQTTARLAQRAHEIATGWESRITIGVESLFPYPLLWPQLEQFMRQHPTIELDLCEHILNGGWEALQQQRIDLLIGAGGPLPSQQGLSSAALAPLPLQAVIGAAHPLSHLAASEAGCEQLFQQARRVVSHDTSVTDIARSAGLGQHGSRFFVQTIEQKQAAIVAGIGIGHLPLHRIADQLTDGVLLPLRPPQAAAQPTLLAWRMANKGRGLQALRQQLLSALAAPPTAK